MHILIYKYPPKPKDKVALHRKLYGYKDYSNNTKYKYERKGIVQKMGLKKIARNTLLINDLLIKTVKNILTKLGAEIIIKQVN